MDATIVSTQRLTKTFGDRAPRSTRWTSASAAARCTASSARTAPGKTTTLRMLLGLVRPDLRPGHRARAARRATRGGGRTGSLVEGPGFYPYLSGRENLRVLARYRGLGDRAVDRVLERVDLTERGGDRFRTYSLGMKQRLGVAAALLGEPDLLVLDEPTNGLDPAGMADMRALLVDVAAGGQTVLLSSHLLGRGAGDLRPGRDHRRRQAAGRVDRGRPARRDRDPAGARRADRPRAGGRDERRRRRRGRGRRPGAAGVRPAAQAPELARALVGAGIDITELTPVERSLEDVFFDLTRTVTEEVPA